MKIGVGLKIDVTKINKEKMFKSQKGAVYLDAQVFISDEVDQFGNNGMIVQAVSKEEREQGIRGAILGNAKIFWTDGGQPQQQRPQQKPQQPAFDDDLDSDIPF